MVGVGLKDVLKAKEHLSAKFLGQEVHVLEVSRDVEGVVAVGVTTYSSGEVGLPPEYSDELVVFVGVVKEDVKVLKRLPASVGGVKVVAIPVGRPVVLSVLDKSESLLTRVSKVRPVLGGVSVGAVGVTAGTLGCVVYDASTGEPLILTNTHVGFPDWGECKIGLELEKKYGKLPVLQPGLYDIFMFGPVEDRIGVMCYENEKCGAVCETLQDYVLNKYLIGYACRHVRVYSPNESGQPGAGKGRNLVDAALVRPVSPDIVKPDILGIGVPGPAVPADAHVIGRPVIKSGRTTGVTCGVVSAIHVDVKVWESDTNYAIFVDQILIKSDTAPFARGGDSGSVVLLKERWPDGTYKTLGLLFAGSASKVDGKWIAMANTATNVEKLLNIRFGPPAKALKVPTETSIKSALRGVAVTVAGALATVWVTKTMK